MRTLKKNDLVPDTTSIKKTFRILLMLGLITSVFGILLAVLCNIISPGDGAIQIWVGIIYVIGILIIIIAFTNYASVNSVRKKIMHNNYVIFEAVLVRERVTTNNSGETTTEQRDYIFEHPKSRSSFAVPVGFFPGYAKVGATYYVLAIPVFSGVYKLYRFFLCKQYPELSEELMPNYWDFLPPLPRKYSIYR